MVDLKQPPYNETFDENKKYYRILSVPGRPIQTREWNDLQEQIQKQIERIGVHLFDNGSQVLPGTDDAVTYRNNIGFIKIPLAAAPTEQAIIDLWLGKEIVATSAPLGVKARVIGYRVADVLTEIRLFIDYLKADETDGTATSFIPGQSIETVEDVPSTTTIAGDLTSVGTSTACFIKSSVYFFNGDFLLVDEQSIFIAPTDPNDQSAWNKTPTAKVGLNVAKSIVTFQQDETLADNASPSDNFGAPGCDRLFIELSLIQKDYNDQNDGSFIELLRVANGVVQSRVTHTNYNVLADTLARRTYDESGHYVVRDFPLTIKTYLKEDDNGGVHDRTEFLYETQDEAEAAGLILFGISGASLDPEFTDKWLPASSYDEFLRLARGKLTLQIDPGKAYVKGYEIEKLAPSYVDIDKARTLRFENNQTVNTELGSFIYVTNLFGAPEIELYETIEIHKKQIVTPGVSPAARIGTAKILAIEYFSGTHGDPEAVYKLNLFDVVADPGVDLSQMKSVVSTTGYSFSADIVLEWFQLEGSVTPGVGINIVGFGTSFVNKASQVVNPDDYVRIGHDDTQIYDVATVLSDTSLDLSSVPTFTGNQTIEVAFASFQGLQGVNSLVFNLPNQFVYTIRSANADNSINDAVIDTFFSVHRPFLATSNGSGVIQIQVTLADEEFEDFSPIDFIVIDLATGDWLRLAEGNTYNGGLTTAGVEAVSATQVKIHADPADAGDQYYIIASVRKTQNLASIEKTKTAIRGEFVLGSYTGPFVETSAGSSDLTSVSLGDADILKVTRIVMSPDFTIAPSSDETLPAGHRDVTDRFDLDDGQRDYYYGIGAVNLKPGKERPTGRIRVEFDFFQHSSQGSYFSVDSYPFKGIGANMDYAEIPAFTDSAGRVSELRDSLDFRARLNPDLTFYNYIEVPRSNVRLDFHHYLNRIDNLYLDRFGNFKVIAGVDDILPLAPEEPGDAMSLYELDLQAYTATPAQCFKRKKDNRRFTMADIGKIEARVANLEYYTLLTLTEKDAKDLAVVDAFGNDRFKNGFIAENFKTLGIANIEDPDFHAAVDQINEEVRPQIHQDHSSLQEKAELLGNDILTEQSRADNNYARTGLIYTLPYSPVKFVEQQLASQVENVNPFAKFTFRGRIALNPATDSWRDVQTLPDLNVVDDTAYLAAQAGVNPNQVIWGEWMQNWVSAPVNKITRKDTVLGYGPNRPNAGHDHYWPEYVDKKKTITTTITTQNIRQGIRREVVPNGYKTQSLGKRIVATIGADYMRSIPVTIKARGFLPNATLYAFFDNQDVGAFCNPSSLGDGQPIRCDATGSVDLIFTIPSAKFLTGQRNFKLTTSSTNELSPQPASEGEALYYAVGWIDQVQDTELSIRQFEVVNTVVTDTQTIPTTTTTIIEHVVSEDPIAQSFVCKEKGGCFLLAVDVFFLSKDANVPIKLQVRPLSDTGLPTNNILSGGEVVKPAADVVINTVDITNGKMTTIGEGSIPGYTTGPWDGSTSNPIEIQRVSAVSGRVIPNNSPLDLLTPQNDMIPSRFIFETPLYLQEGNDYAFVLIADSIAYQAWISQAGPITARPGGTPTFGQDINTVIGTSTPILKDNFIDGVFFRSSNGKTWNPDQSIDMKFALHKASFETNVTGVIEYVNNEIAVQKLQVDPIQTYEGSKKVRVLHPNHGHPAFASPPCRVVLSGILTGNGIDISLLNDENGWPIESVELDSYIINITESPDATASGRTGGPTAYASANLYLDSMFFNVNALSFPECDTDWTYSSTNGGNVSYQDPKNLPFVVNAFAPIAPNETFDFPNPMTISSAINENNSSDVVIGPSKVTTNNPGDRKSLHVKAVIRTTNANLSPAIDAGRLSVISIANRLNRPDGTMNTDIDTLAIIPSTVTPVVATTGGLVTFYNDSDGPDRGRLESDDADIAQHLSKLDVGKLITISGTTAGDRDCTDVRVFSVVYTPGFTPACTVVVDNTFGSTTGFEAADFTLIQKDRFVDEIAPHGGSAAFKYISKQLALARASTALQITFDAYRDQTEDWEVYYKTARTDDNKSDFDLLNWIKADFNLLQNGELVPAYPPASSLDKVTQEYNLTINNLSPFLGFAVKLVGLGGNSSSPPKGSNLKGIALDE